MLRVVQPNKVMVDYHGLILKYYEPGTLLHRVYMAHVTMVTGLALELSQNVRGKSPDLILIEEASMLHDIGIFKTNAPAIGCVGQEPYISHTVIGADILASEGLPKHARVAENHIGVGGISAEEVVKGELPLPARDMLCQTLEEQIISYADLYYSKNPDRLFVRKRKEKVRKGIAKYGERQQRLFSKLDAMLDPHNLL